MPTTSPPRLPATPVGALRIDLHVYHDPPRGYGADARIPAHESTVCASDSKAHTAARSALDLALDTIPIWEATQRRTQRALEERLAAWLRATGAKHTAGTLMSCTSPRLARQLAVQALRTDGASEQQAAALALTAQMWEAVGVFDRFAKRAIETLIDVGMAALGQRPHVKAGT